MAGFPANWNPDRTTSFQPSAYCCKCRIPLLSSFFFFLIVSPFLLYLYCTNSSKIRIAYRQGHCTLTSSSPFRSCLYPRFLSSNNPRRLFLYVMIRGIGHNTCNYVCGEGLKRYASYLWSSINCLSALLSFLVRWVALPVERLSWFASLSAWLKQPVFIRRCPTIEDRSFKINWWQGHNTFISPFSRCPRHLYTINNEESCRRMIS